MRAPLLVAATLVLASCGRCGPASAARDAGPALGAAPTGDAGVVARIPGTGGGEGAGGGAGGRRFQSPIVYLDGTPIAAMAFGELPPTLPTNWTQLPSMKEPVRRFVLIDYLRELGVDIAKLRAVHLYSGRDRVAILTGEQLRAELAPGKDKTQFSFTRSNRGKVQMRWPGSGTPTNDRIDKVATVALYVDKAPPGFVPGKPGLWLDGVPQDGPPYVTADVQGGTRVYVDGRLVAFVRPRDVDPAAPAALLAHLAARGIDVAGVTAGDLIAEDTLLRRLDAAALGAQQFVCPGGGGGALSTVPQGETVHVVQLYKRAAPTLWEKR